jgi:hypothetical protein
MFFEGAFLKHQASSKMRICKNIKITEAKIMKNKSRHICMIIESSVKFQAK